MTPEPRRPELHTGIARVRGCARARVSKYVRIVCMVGIWLAYWGFASLAAYFLHTMLTAIHMCGGTTRSVVPVHTQVRMHAMGGSLSVDLVTDARRTVIQQASAERGRWLA
jgi:hypothetical protein